MALEENEEDVEEMRKVGWSGLCRMDGEGDDDDSDGADQFNRGGSKKLECTYMLLRWLDDRDDWMVCPYLIRDGMVEAVSDTIAHRRALRHDEPGQART